MPSVLKKYFLRIKFYFSKNKNIISIFHSETQWKKLRNQFIQEQPFCQMCHTTKKLEVHHIYPWHLFPEKRYDKTNLITLCNHCHFYFGHFGNWKNYNENIKEMANCLKPYFKE